MGVGLGGVGLGGGGPCVARRKSSPLDERHRYLLPGSRCGAALHVQKSWLSPVADFSFVGLVVMAVGLMALMAGLMPKGFGRA